MSAPLPQILAIDDTPANLMTLGAALEGEFELQLATSGVSGIELALRCAPDLILLDVMMPELDGFETFRRLAAHATLQHIPVIFVTALDDLDFEVQGLSLGASDYITKPINVAIARQRIRNLLERERLRKEVQWQADSLRKLSMAVEQSTASVLITNLDASIEYANPRFTEVTGYSAAEALGKNPRLLHSGLTPKATHLEMWQQLTHGLPWSGDFINKRKNGEVYWEEARIAPIKDTAGVVTHYVSVKTDISARKALEQELAQHLSQLEAKVIDRTNALRASVSTAEHALSALSRQKFVLDQHAIVSITDLAGRSTYCNDQFVEISGYSRAEILGQDHTIVNSGQHAKGFFKGMYPTIAHGGVWRNEVCNRAKQGHLYWVDSTVAAFMNPEGKPLEYLSVSTDITARKTAEVNEKFRRRALEVLTHDTPLATKLASLVHAMELTKPGMLCSILRLDKTGRYFDQTTGPSLPDFYNEAIHGLEIGAGVGSCGTAAFTGQRVIVDDIATHPYWARFKDLAARANLRACWSQPIFALSGRVLGTFAIYHTTVQSPSEADMLLIEQAAHLASVAIEHSHAQQALRDGEAAAQAATQAKSEFLSNMSHEIRTPMNGVIGMLDVLQQTPLMPDQHRMIDTIHKSSLALLNILNDILDFSKIEAGKLAIEAIPTHLREVAEGVTLLMLPVALSKNAQVSLFVDPALPDWVVSDPTRLRQILFNLLGNALKFIPSAGAGTVALRVHPIVQADGLTGLQLCVKDNGIGMSEQVVAQLFQPFMQADASTARKFGGTGLGLSITQRLVDMMGGHICVRSSPGAGSEFIVNFALQAAVAPPGREPVTPTDLAGVHVLAITPDADCATLLQAYLHAAGAQVHVVADMLSARSQRAQLPDNTLLLLGQSTTDEPGDVPGDARAVRLVRRQAEPELAATGTRWIDVFDSPLLYDALIYGVAVASGRRSEASLLLGKSNPQPVTPIPEQAMAKRQLILLAEDNETNREVMQEQLRLLGYAAELAEDGVQALAMWRSGRYSLLLTDCHMPQMDGFELTEAIRQAEPVGTRFPIVAVTANAMQGQAQRCRERGMDDYLSKPLRLSELAPMLQKWLPLAPQSLQALMVETGAQAQAVGLLPVFDAGTLVYMLGDNPVLQRSLLNKFLINSEKQGATMAVAVEACDFGAAADVAHALKSAARTVGALYLGALCEEIETAGVSADGPVCRLLHQGMAQALAQAQHSIQQYLEG